MMLFCLWRFTNCQCLACGIVTKCQRVAFIVFTKCDSRNREYAGRTKGTGPGGRDQQVKRTTSRREMGSGRTITCTTTCTRTCAPTSTCHKYLQDRKRLSGLEAPAASTTVKPSRGLETKLTKCRPRSEDSDAKSAKSRARRQEQDGRARKSGPAGQENHVAPRDGLWAYKYLYKYLYTHLRTDKYSPQVLARPQVLVRG
jgi:hypothetical protein